jgi:hypothetical protein
MVAQHHPLTRREGAIQRPRSVGEDQSANAVRMHPAHARSNFLCRASFIKMHSTLRNEQRSARKRAEHEASGMTGNARDWELAHFLIASGGMDLQIIDQRRETGAEHQPERRFLLTERSGEAPAHIFSGVVTRWSTR